VLLQQWDLPLQINISLNGCVLDSKKLAQVFKMFLTEVSMG